MKYVGIFVCIIIAATVSPVYAGFFDTGSDYMDSDEWSEYTVFDPSDRISITDDLDRLNFTNAAFGGSEDPFRSSASKWYVGLHEDFQMNVGYHFSNVGTSMNDSAGLDFSLYAFNGPLADIAGEPMRFSIGAENRIWNINDTIYDRPVYFAGAETDLSNDEYEVEMSSKRSENDGFFQVNYDSAEDRLWMAAFEYDAAIDMSLPVTVFEYDNVSDLGIDKLGVSLGAWTDGAELTSGEAYFADFQLTGGTPVVTPEPISSVLFLVGGAGLVARRFRK
jgi:hypothetical protein